MTGATAGILVLPISSALQCVITSATAHGNFFLSVLTIGELHKGIEKLVESKRKEELHYWVENDLKERFWNRIIDIDIQVAIMWGEIQGMAERLGRPMPAIDSLIASTGITHHLTVVTRNTSDMKESGVALLNPWE